MRVICINSGVHIGMYNLPQDAKNLLIEGEVYTVIDVVRNVFNEYGYILEEIKSPSLRGTFAAERFIPCSDKDETILKNNKTQVYESEPLR